MIKKEELRIGNILNYTTAENDILPTTIDWQDLKWISEDPKGFNLVQDPIPLTEEWLLKCKFNILGCESESYINDNYPHFIIDILDSGNFGIKLRFPNGHLIDIEFEFLHNLQNIFFDLTGKELEITQ
jgi:hypothetical protein